MLTKEEYLSIIEDFEGIFFEMEIVYNFQDIQKLKDLIKGHFELLKSYEIAMNDLNREWHKDYYVDELEKKIETYENPKPCKFEDLHEGMWVWDNNKKQCIECAPNKNVMGVKCVWYWYDYDFEGELSEDYIEFEERRFFPVTKALEYQE